MAEPAYPIARAAAARVHDYFATRIASHPLVDIDTLEAAINIAFWASLRREEGVTPRVSLAFAPRERVGRPMFLNPPILLTAQSLTKMAPAVDRPGIHLCVCRDDAGLLAWCLTQHLPPFCAVLEIVGPGLLVVKYSRSQDSAKFMNVAVIESDEIKVIDTVAAGVTDCPALLQPMLGLDTQFRSEDSASVLIQIAVSMREHGRGGTLLVVPSETETWRESILSPLLYSVSPAYAARQDALARDIHSIAGLTAVDGATIVNDKLEVLAFGAKIVRRGAAPIIHQLTLTEPIEGYSASVIEPAQLGGTRHLSAAQFTQDQRDSIAMVASQDGRFTVFGWSPCEERVHARRVETLLL
jgi:hypothetical protein